MIKKNNKEWVRQGKCRRCGICCKGDKLSPGPFADDEYVQQFITIIGTDCPHLVYNSKKQAACEIYRNRYPECQAFPKKPEDQELVNAPCGFYFIRAGKPKAERRSPHPGPSTTGGTSPLPSGERIIKRRRKP